MTTKTSHVESALMAELPNTEFRPIFTRLSQLTGMSKSTLYDAYQRLVREGRVRITVEVGATSIVWKKVKEGSPK